MIEAYEQCAVEATLDDEYCNPVKDCLQRLICSPNVSNICSAQKDIMQSRKSTVILQEALAKVAYNKALLEEVAMACKEEDFRVTVEDFTCQEPEEYQE